MPVLAVGLPIGPVGAITHSEALVFLIVSMAGLVAVIGYAVYDVIRRRSALLIYCLAGSVFCNFAEPFWDALGGLRFKDGNIWAFTMFPDLAVPIHYPWWAAFVYSYFTGVASYIFARVFQAGVKRSTFWYLIIGQAVWNIVLEGLVITDAYDYHGDHPWRYGTDFPLWWVFTNYGVVLAGAVIVVATRRWGTRASAAAALVVPSSFAAWEMWSGWPVFAALNSDLGAIGRNIAALLTACISVGTLWAMREFMQPAVDTAATTRPGYSTLAS
jgi:hypothetical protein